MRENDQIEERRRDVCGERGDMEERESRSEKKKKKKKKR